jgi:hypothetical protein
MEQVKQSVPRRRRNKDQIHHLLMEFEKGNKDVKVFCSHHSISTGTFHKWKSRYRSMADENTKSSGFATLHVASSQQRLFAEVGMIKVYQPVSASFLKELL